MMIFVAIVCSACLLMTMGYFGLAIADYIRDHKEVAEKKQDEAVEREMRRDLMDEGFENIMAYSVGGKNGFDGDK